MLQNIDPLMDHLSWTDLPWKQFENNVRHIQERIFRATCKTQWRLVKDLQHLLTQSWSARCLAIRTVTERNSGRYTPGIDGLLFLTPEEKITLSHNLSFRKYHPLPVKRVFIPKKNRKLRPLGIPIMKDRIMHEIVRMAMDPEWESRFETTSFGFRPNRSCQDAIERLRICIMEGSKWILDADIQGSFDNLNHDFILSRIPTFRSVIAKWLKAGCIENNEYKETTTGAPQGAIISPLLTNIALDGMERIFGSEDGRQWHWIPPRERKGKNWGICLVRYADDMVITAPTKEILQDYVMPKLQEFLQERGLVLNRDKTRIVHVSEGFDFLGFHIQQFPRRTLWIQPSKQSVRTHLNKVKEYLRTHKQCRTRDLIVALNPIIRGWANYFRYCKIDPTFSYIDNRIFEMLWRWSKRRHPQKSVSWIKKQYFTQKGNQNWRFAEDDLYLIMTSDIKRQKYDFWVGWLTKYQPKWRLILKTRCREQMGI
jgi:RNA-directed DNA polymerase